MPDLQFFYDESVAHQDRIEKILLDLQHEREAQAADAPAANPESDTTAEPAGAQGTPPIKE